MEHGTLFMGTLTIDGLDIPWEIQHLEGFQRWYGSLPEGPPRPRGCFAQGHVYLEMSPQSYRSHGPLAAILGARLLLLSRELGLGRFFMPPSWITCPDSGLSTEPDGFLVTHASLRSGLARVNPDRDVEMLGRPDMALEIVSRTSARKDRQVLRRLYAASGVPEYWLVEARADAPLLELLVLDAAAGTYREQPCDADGWHLSAVWGRRFRLRRLADAGGLPDYELEVALP